MNLPQILSIIQLATALILIALVLVQERGGGMGETFGGSDSSGAFSQRRGLEKVIFVSTVTGLILFAVTSLLVLFVS